MAFVERELGTFGRGAAGVDRPGVAVGFGDEPEAVTADPGHVRIDDGEAGGDGDARFHRAAAVRQHLAPGLGGEVVRRRDHAAQRFRRVDHQNLEDPESNIPLILRSH